MAENTGRLLIIDDSLFVSRLLARLLERAGHATMAIERPAEIPMALETGVFQAAFVDVNLGGGVDGIGVALGLRIQRPAMRIVVMSGDPASLAKARAAGFRHVLGKPFSEADLMRALEPRD